MINKKKYIYKIEKYFIKVIFLFLLIIQQNAFANNFNLTIKDGLLCNDVLDIELYYSLLYKKFGKPIQKEGALWFKGNENIYGQSVEEFFISDNTSEYEFIGVIVNQKPTDLVNTLKSAPGINATYYNYNKMLSSFAKKQFSDMIAVK